MTDKTAREGLERLRNHIDDLLTADDVESLSFTWRQDYGTHSETPDTFRLAYKPTGQRWETIELQYYRKAYDKVRP